MPHEAPSRVRYDRRSGMVVVEFSNGSLFMVRARSLEGLAGASDNEIAEVEFTRDAALHWRQLKVYHQIDLLMEGIFPCRHWPLLLCWRTRSQAPPDKYKTIASIVC